MPRQPGERRGRAGGPELQPGLRAGRADGSALMATTGDLTFLKLGGELLEPGDGLDAVLASIAALAGRGPLAIVHGGGREIDAETARRGVPKQAVDGLRITDAATLEAVIAVLA